MSSNLKDCLGHGHVVVDAIGRSFQSGSWLQFRKVSRPALPFHHCTSCKNSSAAESMPSCQSFSSPSTYLCSERMHFSGMWGNPERRIKWIHAFLMVVPIKRSWITWAEIWPSVCQIGLSPQMLWCPATPHFLPFSYSSHPNHGNLFISSRLSFTEE